MRAASRTNSVGKIIAAWVVKNITELIAKQIAKHRRRQGHDFVETELQTLAPVRRFSRNVVEIAVDAGGFVLSRGNIISHAWQDTLQNFTRFHIDKIFGDRKEQRRFRGKGVEAGSKPEMRFAQPEFLRWFFYLALSLFALTPRAEAMLIIEEAKIVYGIGTYVDSNGTVPPNVVNSTPEAAYAAFLPIAAIYQPDNKYENLHPCPVTADRGQGILNGRFREYCATVINIKTGITSEEVGVTTATARCDSEYLAEPQYKLIGNGSPSVTMVTCTISLPDRQGDQCLLTKNPVAITNGSKIQPDTDYSGSHGLSFTRRYRSDLNNFSSIATSGLVDYSVANSSSASCRQGRYISKSSPTGAPLETLPYCFPYSGNGAQEYQFYKPDGLVTIFTGSPTAPTKPANINETAIQLTDAQGIKTWKITREDDSVEIYSAGGLLQKKTARAGQLTTFTYSDAATPAAIAPRPNLMLAQTDPFGHTLQWRYNAGGQMVKMIDPALGEFDYTYDARGNMATVVYPPEATGARKTKTYHYEDATNGKLLTGITDENAFRYATYTYNAAGQVTETKHFAAPGIEVNKHTLAYPYQGRTTVTDPLGTARNYDYTNILNYDAVTGVSQPCASCGGSNAQNMTYDANRNITSRADFNNNKTCHTYDLTRNLETGRIEGLSSGADCAAPFAAATLTAPARKITTTWHPAYRLPASITETITGGSKTTTHTYDASGNLTQRAVVTNATTAQGSRTWTWSNYDAYGRAATMTDARGKITTYSYYPNTAAQNTTLANSRGMLASITNAVGHVTTITAYNAHGQPLSITDANGLATSMTYDTRMRLISRTVVGGGAGTGINETTVYDYDGVGQLVKVTLPDLSFVTYTYDGAHRLTQIQDGGGANTGNKIVYTLDAMGNRTAEQSFDPTGALARSRTRVYDALNRLQQDIGATTPATQVNQTGYDNAGNATTNTDPLSRVTTSAFDALNRLVQVTDPNLPTAGITKYDYDAQDNLTKVTDAKSLNTTYTYNGFNELTSQLSPDTGLTTYTYDAASNLLTKTDARDKVAKYVYDNINRVTQIKYFPTTANANANTSADETVTYTYDTGCGNAVASKGRLCSVSDKSGTTTYSYDLQGRSTAKNQTAASLTQSHSYRYNAAGQMDQWVTASGQVIGYGYSNNRVVSISVNGVALAGSITYDPFGPAVAWLWPSATTPQLKTYRDYDLDGRMTRWELKNGVSYVQRDVIWDNASRVTSLKDLLSPTTGIGVTNPQVFGYDNLDRLTTTQLGSATTAAQTLTYDAIGNRTSATINGIIATYNLPTTSHKLVSTVGGANPRAFTYDAMGNLTSDGKYTYTHWNNGRINTVTWSTGTAPNTTTNTATYNINALGQRVRKVTPSNVVGTRRFMYDEAGRLVGEYDSAGKLIQETAWLGDTPIATLRPKSGSTTTPIAVDTFYVHADHLGTPRVITRPSDNKVVWKWDSTEAFGNNAPNENPSALGAFTYNLRMPGQQFDKETGTFYNYFRDYDPSLGRYVQSDPIGLAGGMNTFAYVGGKPLTTFDPRGLRDAPDDGGGNSPPSNPYGLCSDNDCPFPIKLFHRGICDNQPGTCASAMHAAGIPGPYFGHTGKYSKSCLLFFGLGFKATSSVALTAGLNSAAGAGIPGAAGAAAIGNNPVVIGVGAVFALDALFEHCKCKG